MKTLIFGTVLLAASLGVKAQTVGTLVTSGLAEPFGVTVDSNNKYYVTDSANNRVAMYDPGTGVLTNFATGMFNPQGIVAVPGGIVVSDSGNNRLVMLSADGTLNHLAGSATGEPGYADGIGAAAVFNSPAGLAYSASEDAVYVADMLNHIVRKVDLTTTNVTTVVTNDLYRPSDVAVDEQGRVFIADTGNHSIVMSTNGTPVLIAGSGTSYQSGYEDATPGTSALLNSPRGLIWVGGKTGLLVSDTGNKVIRQVNSNSAGTWSVSTYADTQNAGFETPIGLARDNNGNYILADLGADALRIIQVTAPQGPVAEPVIGRVIMATNNFGDIVTTLIPVTNSTYENDITVAIQGEEGTQTYYTIGDEPEDVPSPSTSDFSPPSYQDGASSLPPSIVDPAVHGPDVTIKAIGTQEGRRPSEVVTAQFHFRVANPSILGTDPLSFSMDVGTEGAELWYTTDGTTPTNDAQYATLYAPGEQLNVLTSTNDVDFRARGFKEGYKPSGVVQRTFRYEDVQTSSIGIAKDYNAGIGSTIVIPVQVRPVGVQSLRSLQFRVEITPEDTNTPAVLNQFRTLNIDPTNDFIRVEAPAVAGGVASFMANRYSQTNDGVTTRGLAVSFIGTNANFSITDFGTVAMLAVPVPPNAEEGDKYTVNVLEPSGTSDAQQTPVPLTALPARTINVTNLSYVVGDSAVANWYNAGDFGNGNLGNNDVNNAFYASMGVRTPFQFSDVFDAMDAFPLDTDMSAGGDGQIRYLDWQVILQRSLRLNTNNWARSWSDNGRRSAERAELNALPNTPAEEASASDPDAAWFTHAWLGAEMIENAAPGERVSVPVILFTKQGYSVSGFQLLVSVEPGADAPGLQTQATFVPSDYLPEPIVVQELPLNKSGCAWSLVQNPIDQGLSGSNVIGAVEFVVPETAGGGDFYTIRFENVDGAPGDWTQYEFESFPSRVWVGSDAQLPQQRVSDEWIQSFFGKLDNPLAAPDADPDADGATNLQEFTAGTNPGTLRVHSAPDWADGLSTEGFKLKWYGAPGKSYRIESCADLGGESWAPVSKGLQGNGRMMEFTVPPGSDDARFFRIVVEE